MRASMINRSSRTLTIHHCTLHGKAAKFAWVRAVIQGICSIWKVIIEADDSDTHMHGPRLELGMIDWTYQQKSERAPGSIETVASRVHEHNTMHASKFSKSHRFFARPNSLARAKSQRMVIIVLKELAVHCKSVRACDHHDRVGKVQVVDEATRPARTHCARLSLAVLLFDTAFALLNWLRAPRLKHA